MANILAKIEHNGIAVRSSDAGDFYSLTDMWKACGSDPSKSPNRWLKTESAIQFVEFIEENLKGTSAPFEGIRTVRGGNEPGTWAHWQIALAYAKYLSHEFHAKCNTVIRAFADGKLTGEIAARDKFLERVVLSLPKPRPTQWDQSVISSIAKMLRQSERNSLGGAPVWLGSVIARLSKMRFGVDIHKVIKELADESGAKHYEHMSDDTIRALQELQSMVVFAASQHGTWQDAVEAIRRYCNFTNGLGAQLQLPAMGNFCECGHALDGHAKFCPECGKRVDYAA